MLEGEVTGGEDARGGRGLRGVSCPDEAARGAGPCRCVKGSALAQKHSAPGLSGSLCNEG